MPFANSSVSGAPPLIVHRYDSLSLLNQVVFTKDRPRSRLAREYGRLVREIVGRNLEDRYGALDYVQRAGERWRRRGRVFESPEKINANLDRIERRHADDGDVLFALGGFFENDGQQERAVSLLNRAMEAGCEEPEAYLKRARVRAEDDPTGAAEDALRALEFDGLPPPLVREAAQLVSEERAGDVAESKAVMSLDVDGRVWLARMLAGSRKGNESIHGHPGAACGRRGTVGQEAGGGDKHAGGFAMSDLGIVRQPEDCWPATGVTWTT